jgi:galactokinase
MRRLAANFPGAPLGLDLAFSSDLPRAAGVSSSSAIIVGTTNAFVTRGGLRAREEWARAVVTPEDLATYCGCIESGHHFGGLVGNAGVGTHGGSEDHTAILMSPGRRCLPGWPPPCVSGVHADKPGRARSL